MDLIKANWGWIASNPWGFAALSLLTFGLGWGLAKLLYNERMELLKAQITSPRKSNPEIGPATDFRYRSHGRHGRNVLAETTHDVAIDEKLSFQANVPEGKKLHVVLHGPQPQSLSEASGAWYFSGIGVNNWTSSKYQENTSGCVQHFNAEEGPADMQFFFSRLGQFKIEAFEADDRTATWSKNLHVSDKTGA